MDTIKYILFTSRMNGRVYHYPVYRCVLQYTALCLLTVLLHSHNAVHGNTEHCNIRIWYVDMLAEGHLMDSLTEEQLVAKSQIEIMLKQAKLKDNNMVQCDILNTYRDIFATQEQVPMAEENEIEDLNMDVIDETEFGDETDFTSNEDDATGSKVDDLKNQPDESNKIISTAIEENDKISKKKKIKLKPKKSVMHISSFLLGVCFRDKSYVLQNLLEIKIMDSIKLTVVKEHTIILRNVSNRCNLKHHCLNYCHYINIFKHPQCFVEYSMENLTNKESNKDNLSTETDSQQQSKSDDTKEQVETIDVGVSLERDDSSTNYEGARLHMDLLSENTDGLNVQPTADIKQDQVNTPNPNFDFVKFEQQFTLKANEYESKIQSLEIMIIRLENRLLTEKIMQNNDTSSFTRLENQILKVENELLKMNKSYFHLLEENEMLKTRQGKYLELAHIKHQSLDNTNSSKQYELISQQHVKITQLNYLLQNHSDLFDKLKHKHELLEGQNQMLHQIIMNQTAILSNIMKKMQEISDDNNKQRQETQSLKAKLDIQTTSNDILEKLEHLVSDRIATVPSTEDDVKSSEKEYPQKENPPPIYKFFPEFPTAWIHDEDEQWQCQGNKSPRFCLFFSIILSHCPPFSPVYWNKCPFLLNRMEVDTHIHYNTDKEPILELHSDIHEPQTKPNVNHNDKTKQYTSETDSEQKNTKRGDRDVGTNMKNNKLTIQNMKTDEKEDEMKEKDFKDVKIDTTETAKKPVTTDKTDMKTDKKTVTTDKTDMKTDKKPVTTDKTDMKTDKKTVKTDKKAEKKDIKTIKDAPTDQKADKKDATINEDVQTKNVKSNQDEKTSQKDEKTDKKDEKTDKKDDKTDKKDDKTDKKDEKTDKKDDKTDKKDDKTDQKDEKTDKKDDKTDKKDEKTGKKDDKTDKKVVKTIKKDLTADTKEKIDKKDEKPDKKNEKMNGKENLGDLKNKAAVEKENIHSQNTPHKLLYSSEWTDKAKDCYSLYEKGHSLNRMYRIYLPGSGKQISVLCDMRKGGWTIILKRVDGSVDFNRDWSDYKAGFGGHYTEHWIGNDNLHYLTNQDYYTLRVEIVDWGRQRRYAEYDEFWVEDADANYRLHIGGYSGDAGDGFLRHNNMMFSTYDNDNDLLKETQMGGSCAKRFKGGGWYYRCYNNNLFGIYYQSEQIPEKHFDGITWKPWKGPNNSMKEIVLKIRPRHASDL